MNKVSLRLAQISDMDLLQKWDTESHVKACDPNSSWDWEVELSKEETWLEQYIAECSGVPFAFLQIIDPLEEESHYWGDVEPNLRAIDIWIGPSQYLGKGLGAQIMHWALRHCFIDRGAKAVLVDPLSSNTGAIRFYSQLGFTFRENRKFDDDLCTVYQIKLEEWRTCNKSSETL